MLHSLTERSRVRIFGVVMTHERHRRNVVELQISRGVQESACGAIDRITAVAAPRRRRIRRRWVSAIASKGTCASLWHKPFCAPIAQRRNMLLVRRHLRVGVLGPAIALGIVVPEAA